MRDIAGAPAATAAVAVVADDLTGAADTGAAFAAAGLAALVTWQRDGVAAAVRDVDVLAIDAGTRALDAAGATAATARLVAAVRTAGVGAIYKKGDSLLRGHIGEETAAVLASWHEGAVAVAAFAFPDAGRTTIHGRQRAAGLETGLPIAPLFDGAGLTTCAIDLERVRGEDFAARVADAAGRSAVIVCDAIGNDDLARIVHAGRALKAPVVWVGTGGLARALAAAMRPHGRRAPAAGPVSRRGPVLIVCGSASRVAREQVARAIASGVAPVEVSPAALRPGTAAAERVRAVDALDRILDRGDDVIVFPTVPDGPMDPDVARGLGELVASLATRAGGVALTGGDTATAVLRAWGMTGLRIVGEIEPGVAMSISEGAQRMAVVTKAGAFGSPDVLVKARAALRSKG